MDWKRSTVALAILAFAGASLPVPTLAKETEQQLEARIKSEPNPVRKAKDEIKLGNVKFSRVQYAYAHGKIEEGAKSLGSFLEIMNTSQKLLRDSGRNAAKQPEGFRELEIALREHSRALQDLGRTVSYYDRGPLEDAERQLEEMRGEVLKALFPGGNSKTPKNAPDPHSAEIEGNTAAR